MVFVFVIKYVFDVLCTIATYWDYEILNCISILALVFILWTSLDVLFGVGVPPTIKNIPSIPGYPIVGNLFQVVNNPALVYLNWSKKYQCSIFQVRLGIKRVVVVNSYQDVKNLWIKHSCSNNSRPVLYTFHDVVSATQGFTIGSTPVGSSFKKKKKVVSQGLNHKNVCNMDSLIDEETRYTIRKIIQTNPELNARPFSNINRYSRTILSDVDLLPYAQLFALRSSIYITYGIHLDVHGCDAELAKEVIEVENNIMKFRAPMANLQDYIPILRYLPFGRNVKAQKYRHRRDVYMNELLKDLKRRVDSGNPEAENSLIGQTLKNKDQNQALTPAETQSICLTMVSAGLDNTPLNFNHLMGQLSHPTTGYVIQRRAFEEIMNLYSNDVCLAWDHVAKEISCDYVVALVQETLRFFSVLPLGLPRATSKDISYQDLTIPKNTTLFMNTFAANHDPTVFPNPMCFKPERWLDSQSGKMLSKHDVLHFSFGAGSRMCSGNHLAFKELYTLVCRMIIVFQVKRPTSSDMLMEVDPFKNNSDKTAISFEPKLFKVRLEPRLHNDSDGLYRKILKG